MRDWIDNADIPARFGWGGGSGSTSKLVITHSLEDEEYPFSDSGIYRCYDAKLAEPPEDESEYIFVQQMQRNPRPEIPEGEEILVHEVVNPTVNDIDYYVDWPFWQFYPRLAKTRATIQRGHSGIVDFYEGGIAGSEEVIEEEGIVFARFATVNHPSFLIVAPIKFADRSTVHYEVIEFNPCDEGD